MTIIEYARMLIADKDLTNPLFSDEEIQMLIDKNQVYGRYPTEQVAPKVFRIKVPYTVFGDGYTVVLEDGTIVPSSDYILQHLPKLIIFNNEAPEQEVYIEGYFLDDDNFKADAFEMIAADFRKLQNYAIQNINGNLADAKEHLFRLARYFRTPR